MRSPNLLNGRLLVAVAIRFEQSSALSRSSGPHPAQNIFFSRWVQVSKQHKLFAAEERKLIAAAESIRDGLIAASRAGSLSELGSSDDRTNDRQVRISVCCYANCSAHTLALYLAESKELPAEAICLLDSVATGNM